MHRERLRDNAGRASRAHCHGARRRCHPVPPDRLQPSQGTLRPGLSVDEALTDRLERQPTIPCADRPTRAHVIVSRQAIAKQRSSDGHAAQMRCRAQLNTALRGLSD